MVPFPAGGTTDILARAVGNDMQKAWGQAVVVENRPGAGGNLGSDVVAKASPDGYTLLVGAVSPHGAQALGNTAEEFTEFLRAEIAKWAKVVKTSGARND